jgi:dipeptidyl aminopeptidase/acylaminoacyl peptidase
MLRNILLGFIFLLLLVVGSLLIYKHQADKHFYAGYKPEPPQHVVVEPPVLVESTVKTFGEVLPARYRKQVLTFESNSDERVPVLLTLPVDMEEGARLPAIILIHGSHQEKEFLEEICTPFNEAGFAMASFDQYMRGSRKVEEGVLSNGLAFRARFRKTVHETQRLIDYLETRSDIDSRRIYLIGASYGAITGTTVVAREKRIRAAALVVGGGNFRILAKAPRVRESLAGWMQPLAGFFMTALAGPGDPIRHAAQTAGTPVLMLNGTNDRVVTPEAGEALFAALGEPKEIRWYPVDHPDQEKNGKEVIRMLKDGLAWMLEQDAPYREAPAESPAEP